jgi:phosphatidate phosphatase APP1
MDRLEVMKHLLLAALLLPLVACADGNAVVFYDGYGSEVHFVVKGRVIEAEERSPAKASDSWLHNLWRNFRTMKNSEREDVALTLRVGSYEALTSTDDEGYFGVTVTPAQPLPPGWHRILAQGKRVQGEGRLLIVPRSNTVGVISDIDDTVLVSEVPNKKKLLENTLLKNPLQRQVFPNTARFYEALLAHNAVPNAAPMFYVSASPHQLAGNIETFLSQNHFPQGVLVTKQISGNGRDPLLDQKQYKIAQIETILAALPWVKFVLVGDDGELDPETYHAIREKHPQRVLGIYIRKVSSDPKRMVYPYQIDLAIALGR